jgi:hypothetical protein
MKGNVSGYCSQVMVGIVTLGTEHFGLGGITNSLLVVIATHLSNFRTYS